MKLTINIFKMLNPYLYEKSSFFLNKFKFTASMEYSSSFLALGVPALRIWKLHANIGKVHRNNNNWGFYCGWRPDVVSVTNYYYSIYQVVEKNLVMQLPNFQNFLIIYENIERTDRDVYCVYIEPRNIFWKW